MQEKPIHNKYNGNKNTKNKNFNRHRSTHKNYKNTKHNKAITCKKKEFWHNIMEVKLWKLLQMYNLMKLFLKVLL